jgi:predicted dehydrogenase
VGFQDLYVPGAHDIKGRVLAGELGRLQRITVRAQWPRPESYYARNAWAGRLRADGAWVLDSPVNNAFAHFLMLALFWAGTEPTTAADVVQLEAELYRAHAIESFDTVSLRAHTASGVEILFYGSHAGRENRAPEIKLSGDAGEITWVYEENYAIRRAGAAAEHVVVPSQLDTRLSVLESLVARLRGEHAFIVTPELARSHTRIMNALHEFFPIHDLDPRQIEVTREGEEVFRRVRQFDALVDEAARRHALFSEASAPWAIAGSARSLFAYESFGGCWTASDAGTVKARATA